MSNQLSSSCRYSALHGLNAGVVFLPTVRQHDLQPELQDWPAATPTTAIMWCLLPSLQKRASLTLIQLVGTLLRRFCILHRVRHERHKRPAVWIGS